MSTGWDLLMDEPECTNPDPTVRYGATINISESTVEGNIWGRCGRGYALCCSSGSTEMSRTGKAGYGASQLLIVEKRLKAVWFLQSAEHA